MSRLEQHRLEQLDLLFNNRKDKILDRVTNERLLHIVADLAEGIPITPARKAKMRKASDHLKMINAKYESMKFRILAGEKFDYSDDREWSDEEA